MEELFVAKLANRIIRPNVAVNQSLHQVNGPLIETFDNTIYPPLTKLFPDEYDN
jgi:hypothetical protein